MSDALFLLIPKHSLCLSLSLNKYLGLTKEKDEKNGAGSSQVNATPAKAKSDF